MVCRVKLGSQWSSITVRSVVLITGNNLSEWTLDYTERSDLFPTFSKSSLCVLLKVVRRRSSKNTVIREQAEAFSIDTVDTKVSTGADKNYLKVHEKFFVQNWNEMVTFLWFSHRKCSKEAEKIISTLTVLEKMSIIPCVTCVSDTCLFHM